MSSRRRSSTATSLDDDALGGEDGGGRQAGQRTAQRRAEQLRLRVGDDEDGEGGGGQAREDEEHRDGQLRARVGTRAPLGHPGLVGHGARSPIRRATASRAAMARNHVTIPSGTGPRLPMPQPPRLSGWRSDCT